MKSQLNGYNLGMIIFINGTISSGKTTIAKLLQKRIPNTAIVEVDALRNFISDMALEESIPLNLENAVSVIKNFANRNLNIIVPYPLSEKNYNYFVENLKTIDTKKFVFTLCPKPTELINWKRGRKLNNWEKERIKHHTKIGLTNPTFGQIIDNTNQTPDETVKIILNFLK